MNKTPKYTATAIVKLWRDTRYGNTYHSVHVIRHSDGAVVDVPIRYGYGDAYMQSARTALIDAQWVDAGILYRDFSASIIWTVSYGTKGECVANGTTSDPV